MNEDLVEASCTLLNRTRSTSDTKIEALQYYGI